MLVSDSAHDRPAPEALDVVRLLDRARPAPGAGIAAIRQRYAAARKALIAKPEPVSHVHRLPRGENVQPLTVFAPRGSRSGRLPALVYFHGGGWTVGGLETYEPLCRKLANATGCAIVWVEYRLAPEHPFPAAYDDARAAFAWVCEHHVALGLDGARIGVAGDSAGGNLAAALCLAARDEDNARAPWLQLLIYPCLDMQASLPSHKTFAEGYGLTASLYAWYRGNYAGGQAKPGHWRLSPLFAHSVKGLPPTVLLYAGFDILRDEAAAYAERLADAGVPLENLYFPDMIHGFLALGGAIPAAEAGIRRIADAIRALTGAGTDQEAPRLV